MGEMQGWPTQATKQASSSPWSEIGEGARSHKKQHSERASHRLSSCEKSLVDAITEMSTVWLLIGPDVDLGWLMFCWLPVGDQVQTARLSVASFNKRSDFPSDAWGVVPRSDHCPPYGGKVCRRMGGTWSVGHACTAEARRASTSLWGNRRDWCTRRTEWTGNTTLSHLVAVRPRVVKAGRTCDGYEPRIFKLRAAGFRTFFPASAGWAATPGVVNFHNF